jgi:hypothetical protein
MSMKHLIITFLLVSCASARDKPVQITQYSDRALGLSGWKVEHLPKAKAHKFGPFPWCEMVPYLMQELSGKTQLSLRITAIVARPDPNGTAVATLPDEITVRADDETLTVKYPRKYENFGASREDFIIDDDRFIEKIALSRETWIVAYTTFGDKDRNDMSVPEAWRQAIKLLIEQRRKLQPTLH